MKKIIKIILIILILALLGYYIYINVIPRKEKLKLYINYENENIAEVINVGKVLKINNIEFKITDIDRNYIKIKSNKYIYELINEKKDDSTITNIIIVEREKEKSVFLNNNNNEIVFEYK